MTRKPKRKLKKNYCIFKDVFGNATLHRDWYTCWLLISKRCCLQVQTRECCLVVRAEDLESGDLDSSLSIINNWLYGQFIQVFIFLLTKMGKNDLPQIVVIWCMIVKNFAILRAMSYVQSGKNTVMAIRYRPCIA